MFVNQKTTSNFPMLYDNLFTMATSSTEQKSAAVAKKSILILLKTGCNLMNLYTDYQ